MFFGSAFLINSLVEISKILIMISFLLILMGIGCAIFAISLNRRSLYLFFAALFLQAGLFLFLDAMHIIPIPFSRAWPLLSVFVGLAFLPAGWHRYGSIRINYIVLSIAFVALGSVLMVFSLDLVGFSLTQFIRGWWPLLLLLAGLTLVLISLGTRLLVESKKQ